ncbi:Aminoglycoside phosphotransferase (fragment) [Cupriavidus taiwanensis]|uniref:Aminoglycoside phosphotransferase n=1 Tax=Cupriavidus taiwanensis TaxID=164546 RepID=A0A375EAK7_9BURK
MAEAHEFAGTVPVREQHRFDQAALERWMAQHVDGYAGPLTIDQFKGGQSNPTYRLRSPGHSYVLRRKPPGELLRGRLHGVKGRAARVTASSADAHAMGERFARVADLAWAQAQRVG